MRINFVAAVFALTWMPVAGIAFWGGGNPVRDAVKEGSFNLTLADYKAGTREDRADLVAAYVTERSLPGSDRDIYVSCVGEYAATKLETLDFAEVFQWCEGEARNDRALFEAHFNELDAKDLAAEAAVLCKTYVKTQLKSPATADFPFALNTSGKGRWRYLVNSNVDSQNGFGAVVRTYFVCDMQYTGGPEGDGMDYRNWEMLDFQAQQ